MLEKPDLQDEKISACLQAEYGLNIVEIAFLPIGADLNTAVYRALTNTATPYFVKLRSGLFDETTILAPKLLYDQGVSQIIPPLPTHLDRLWASLDDFTVTVFPFIDGRDGYEVDLSDHHWVDFGRALKGIHTAVIPQDLIARLRREIFSARWRETVKRFQAQVEAATFADPVAAELAAFLQLKHDQLSALVSQTDRLAAILQRQALPFMLCHADIHAGNILIDTNGTLYIVDWDTLIFAPKERDLMYAGGGQFPAKRTPDEEERLFYQGYGPTEVNPVALTYYLYERIIEDIAVECEQILLTTEGGDDRAQALQYMKYNFLPNGTIEMAYRSEEKLRPELKSPRL